MFIRTNYGPTQLSSLLFDLLMYYSLPLHLFYSASLGPSFWINLYNGGPSESPNVFPWPMPPFNPRVYTYTSPLARGLTTPYHPTKRRVFYLLSSQPSSILFHSLFLHLSRCHLSQEPLFSLRTRINTHLLTLILFSISLSGLWYYHSCSTARIPTVSNIS